MGHRQVSLRRASTVCLVRDNGGIEVLMVLRPDTARFMPCVWVFPGGAVDEADARAPKSFGPSGEGTDWLVAALRELIEETGVWLTTEGARTMPFTDDVFGTVEASPYQLDQNALVYFANWVTPAAFPIRFDTRFFLAVAEPDTEATHNPDELVDLVWVSPAEALARNEADDWDVAFPTRRTLELLTTESSAGDVVERLRSVEVVAPVQPRLYVDEHEARILLPDDPGFEEAAIAQRDPEILERLSRVLAMGGRIPAELKGHS
jgi:8-oxo-dGTP pyrophosphatase MutT (NUDIX family)